MVPQEFLEIWDLENMEKEERSKQIFERELHL